MTRKVRGGYQATGPKPLVKQITEWHRVSLNPEVLLALHEAGSTLVEAYQRDVTDGHLTVFIAKEPAGKFGTVVWHLSISHRTNSKNPEAGRYPSWDEITEARYRFIPNEVTMVMYLPPREQYISHHDTTFHLWEEKK